MTSFIRLDQHILFNLRTVMLIDYSKISGQVVNLLALGVAKTYLVGTRPSVALTLHVGNYIRQIHPLKLIGCFIQIIFISQLNLVEAWARHRA